MMYTDVDDRRIVTSAIDGMSVAEVRRALATMRKNWEESNSSDNVEGEHRRPFYISSDPLVRGYSTQEFAYMFVQGHHAKRINKNKVSASPSASIQP